MSKLENTSVSFRWNNQLEDQITTFVELRKSEALVDCTIVAGLIGGDCQKFKAHRIILCANSLYISDLIFSKNGEKCVDEIHLPSIPPKDMAYILDFMYKGVVQVEVSDVNSFLHSAHFLQVSGIIEKGSFKNRFYPSKPSKNNEGKSKQPGPRAKKARISINPPKLSKHAKSDFESEEEIVFSNQDDNSLSSPQSQTSSVVIVLSDSDDERNAAMGLFNKVNTSNNASPGVDNVNDRPSMELNQENQIHKTAGKNFLYYDYYPKVTVVPTAISLFM